MAEHELALAMTMTRDALERMGKRWPAKGVSRPREGSSCS
jgi:hypothetical protein